MDSDRVLEDSVPFGQLISGMISVQYLKELRTPLKDTGIDRRNKRGWNGRKQLWHCGTIIQETQYTVYYAIHMYLYQGRWEINRELNVQYRSFCKERPCNGNAHSINWYVPLLDMYVAQNLSGAGLTGCYQKRDAFHDGLLRWWQVDDYSTLQWGKKAIGTFLVLKVPRSGI